MPHIPYQPRPLPPALAPLAIPLPKDMEEVPVAHTPPRDKAPLPPRQASPAPVVPTKPRLRTLRVGLDRISLNSYGPTPDQAHAMLRKDLS